nr:WD repeat-containing protein 13 [Cryptomonas paramecium]
MIVKPHGIAGANFEFSFPFFLKRNNEIFFLLSVHSCLNLFKLKTLSIKTKSPFIHHRFPILDKVLVKNRIIIILKNGIHVLDYFIPLTRFFYFFKKPDVFFINQFLIIIYDKMLKKFTILNPWTFSLFCKFKLPNKIICIQVTKCTKFQKNVCILNDENEIEVRNQFMQKKMVLKLYSTFTHQCFSSNSINFSNSFIYRFNKKTFIYDFLLKKKIYQFKTKIFHFNANTVFYKKNLIIGYKNHFLFYCIPKGSLKKIKLRINFSKNYFFKIYKNFTLNLKFYNQAIYLYQYSHKKAQFSLIVCRFSNRYPSIRLKKHENNKHENIYIDLIGRICLWKYNYIRSIIFKKEKKLKPRVIHFQTTFFQQKKNFYLIIIFQQFNYPYIWKISQTRISKLKIVTLLEKKKQGKVTSIFSIKNSNELCIMTYRKNLVCLFDLNRIKYLCKKKNHITTKKKTCKVTSVFCNTTGSFFISLCFCNILIIWKTKNFQKIQYIKIKNQIYFLKWFCKFNIITIVDYHNQILLMFLNCFFNLKKCIGHEKKINDILIVKNLNFLISSSFDKTIRVWDLFRNKCKFAIKFSYSPCYLVINRTQDTLISGHLFTTGLSLFRINKCKFLRYFFYLYKDLNEQSKKILPIFFKRKKNFFLSIYKSFYKKKNSNFFIKTMVKFKKTNKTSLDIFKNVNFLALSFRKIFLPKLYLYDSKDCISLKKTVFFTEFYLNNLVCGLKTQECVEFFLFFYENIFLGLNPKSIQVIVQVISNELSRIFTNLRN